MKAQHLPVFACLNETLLRMLLRLPLSMSNLQTHPPCPPGLMLHTALSLKHAPCSHLQWCIWCLLHVKQFDLLCTQHLWVWLCHKIGIREGHRGAALANQEGLSEGGDGLVETEGVSKRKTISPHSEHPQPAFFPSFPRSHFLLYIMVTFFTPTKLRAPEEHYLWPFHLCLFVWLGLVCFFVFFIK